MVTRFATVRWIGGGSWIHATAEYCFVVELDSLCLALFGGEGHSEGQWNASTLVALGADDFLALGHLMASFSFSSMDSG